METSWQPRFLPARSRNIYHQILLPGKLSLLPVPTFKRRNSTVWSIISSVADHVIWDSPFSWRHLTGWLIDWLMVIRTVNKTRQTYAFWRETSCYTLLTNRTVYIRYYFVKQRYSIDRTVDMRRCELLLWNSKALAQFKPTPYCCCQSNVH